MKNIDKKLLFPLLAVESESGDMDAMRDHVGGVLSTMAGVSWDVDEWGNIIASKGAGAHPPCVVAHLDTVHDITGHGIVPIEHGGRITGLDPVTMQQTGIGGDDKCGIYAALFLLRELSNCRVILTVDEEIGAVGASKLDLCHLEGVGFLLQADRRGSADMVTRACGDALASPAFIKVAARIGKRYGYKRCEDGGLTDVQELVSRGVGLCALNLSAGYHRPHQPSEYIDLCHLSQCVGFMLALCQSFGGREWRHTLPPRPKYSPKAYTGGAYASYASSPAEQARLDKYWADLQRGAYPTQADKLAREARIEMEREAEKLGAFGMPDWDGDGIRSAEECGMEYMEEEGGVVWFADRHGNPYGYEEADGSERIEDVMLWGGQRLTCTISSEG
jgi:hypothetical protein